MTAVLVTGAAGFVGRAMCRELQLRGHDVRGATRTSSGDLQVPVGGSEVVTATVTGTKENAVEWNVTGSGCSRSACGKMADGLYLAPTVLPNPPIVTVTAVSKADPTASASVTVHIGQAPPH